MSVRNEIARLRRSVDELYDVVESETRSKAGLVATDRRFARNEIEACIQRLNELRDQLG